MEGSSHTQSLEKGEAGSMSTEAGSYGMASEDYSKFLVQPSPPVMIERSIGSAGIERRILGRFAFGPMSAFVIHSMLLALVSRLSAAKLMEGSLRFR